MLSGYSIYHNGSKMTNFFLLLIPSLTNVTCSIIFRLNPKLGQSFTSRGQDSVRALGDSNYPIDRTLHKVRPSTTTVCLLVLWKPFDQRNDPFSRRTSVDRFYVCVHPSCLWLHRVLTGCRLPSFLSTLTDLIVHTSTATTDDCTNSTQCPLRD